MYEGTFPCADCPGIDVTLWLRPDGAFFLRQHYLEEDGPGVRSYGLGLWSWEATDETLTLDGGGPPRVFEFSTDGVLAQRVPSDLPHHLIRTGDPVLFADTLMLEGQYAVSNGQPTFSECRTGLDWLVAKSGDYRRLRHQYGRVPRGETALLRARAHQSSSGGRTILVVDEVIRLEPGARCP